MKIGRDRGWAGESIHMDYSICPHKYSRSKKYKSCAKGGGRQDAYLNIIFGKAVYLFCISFFKFEPHKR